MNINISLILLLACLIYLKMNQGKNNYLCYCVIALVSVGLFKRERAVEGFDGTQGLFNGKGLKITYIQDAFAPTLLPADGLNNSDAYLTYRLMERDGGAERIGAYSYRYIDGTRFSTDRVIDGLHYISTDYAAVDNGRGILYLNGSETINISDTVTIDQVDTETTEYRYLDTLDDLEYSTIFGSDTDTFQVLTELPIPADSNNYLIIKRTIAGDPYHVEFYIYKVQAPAPETPESGGFDGNIGGVLTLQDAYVVQLDYASKNSVANVAGRTGNGGREVLNDVSVKYKLKGETGFLDDGDPTNTQLVVQPHTSLYSVFGDSRHIPIDGLTIANDSNQSITYKYLSGSGSGLNGQGASHHYFYYNGVGDTNVLHGTFSPGGNYDISETLVDENKIPPPSMTQSSFLIIKTESGGEGGAGTIRYYIYHVRPYPLCGVSGSGTDPCTELSCGPPDNNNLYQISIGGEPAPDPTSIRFTSTDQQILVTCSASAGDPGSAASIDRDQCPINGIYTLTGCSAPLMCSGNTSATDNIVCERTTLLRASSDSIRAGLDTVSQQDNCCVEPCNIPTIPSEYSLTDEGRTAAAALVPGSPTLTDGVSCTNGATGTATITACESENTDVLFGGCRTDTPVICTSKSDKTGYAVTEGSLVRGENFSVTGSCADNYTGKMVVEQCPETGGEYDLKGCKNKDDYDTAMKVLAFVVVVLLAAVAIYYANEPLGDGSTGGVEEIVNVVS
jgi:hypothetical protein